MDATARRRAELLRQALIAAAVQGYEEAALSGLCAEGAWEAAVSAMRALDLDSIHPERRSGPDGPA
jgi:hypothetical protein